MILCSFILEDLKMRTMLLSLKSEVFESINKGKKILNIDINFIQM